MWFWPSGITPLIWFDIWHLVKFTDKVAYAYRSKCQHGLQRKKELPLLQSWYLSLNWIRTNWQYVLCRLTDAWGPSDPFPTQPEITSTWGESLSKNNASSHIFFIEVWSYISCIFQDVGAHMLGNNCEQSLEVHKHAELTRQHPTPYEAHNVLVSCGSIQISRVFQRGWRDTFSLDHATNVRTWYADIEGYHVHQYNLARNSLGMVPQSLY